MSDLLRKDLLSRLDRLDEDASLMYDRDEQFKLVIVGGSALILLERITRATHDVDAISASYEIIRQEVSPVRNLTFAGFLKCYVRSLSLTGSLSLFKLAKEAAENNPRLREPLLLYAVFADKTDVLLRASRAYALSSEYKRLTGQYNKSSFEAAFQSSSSLLPEEYKKVWKTYQSKKSSLQNDYHTKELMRSRILKLQNAKGISNYRLYADLHLNPGNFNAWLKYGDPKKISLDTARRAVNYLEIKPQKRL